MIRMEKSPVSKIMNYTFKRKNKEDYSEESVSETPEGRPNPFVSDQLNAATPDCKKSKQECNFSVIIPSARRNSDMVSSETSQNIFNRRLSKAMISRQDSIFTHTSNMNVTTNPNTGKFQVNQYVLAKKIGKGSFAEVFLAYDVITKKKFAIKIVQLPKLRRIITSKSTNGIDSLKQEISIMKKLNHKHLIKMYEALGDQGEEKIYIVTEYMKGGSLASKLQKSIMDLGQIRKYFRQMVVGLEYCHTIANICHRDIKPENMLLGENGELKIADFGISSLIENGND